MRTWSLCEASCICSSSKEFPHEGVLPWSSSWSWLLWRSRLSFPWGTHLSRLSSLLSFFDSFTSTLAGPSSHTGSDVLFKQWSYELERIGSQVYVKCLNNCYWDWHTTKRFFSLHHSWRRSLWVSSFLLLIMFISSQLDSSQAWKDCWELLTSSAVEHTLFIQVHWNWHRWDMLCKLFDYRIQIWSEVRYLVMNQCWKMAAAKWNS